MGACARGARVYVCVCDSCACVCVCVCVCACARACAHACVCVWVRASVCVMTDKGRQADKIYICIYTSIRNVRLLTAPNHFTDYIAK